MNMANILNVVLFITFIRLNGVFSQTASVANQFLPEDARLNFLELAKKYGHPAEEFNVTTEDGYINRMFHIPGDKGNRPLLIMHGLFDSADGWIIRGNSSLAVYYAALGYDLWFPNVRGNRYSRHHVRLNPDKDPEFWDFTVHEHGYYDLAASIDFILNKTAAQNLTALGYSQGNTMFYVLTSTRPEYNSKIHLLIALSPICYMHNSKQPLTTIIAFSPFIYRIFSALGVTEVFGDQSSITTIIKLFCPRPLIGYVVCVQGLLFPLIGYDTEQLEAKFTRIALGHSPTGTSSRNLYHFAQFGLRKQFAQFDYGLRKNLLTYGSAKPPVYDLKKVTISVALIAAENDRVSTIANVEILKSQLPRVIKYVVNEYQHYNHIDYALARDNKVLLFPYINEVLNCNP